MIKQIIAILLILQISSLFAQDIIVTKDKEIINANIIYIKSDTIKYVNLDYSLEEIEFVSKDSIYGIKYKNGDYYKVNKKGLSVKQTIINIKRTSKKGWHFAIENIVGIGQYNYTPKYNYGTDFYSETETSQGLLIEATLNTKLYFNNASGIKIGIGYNYSEFTQNSIVKYTDSYILDNYTYLPYKSKIKRVNSINSIAIPIHFFVSPGNKFGVYAEIGGTIYVPLVANYTESEFVIDEGLKYNNGSFKNEIPVVDLFLSAGFGFHATIKEKWIVSAGPTLINVNINDLDKSMKNSTYFIGMRIGIVFI